MSLNNNNQLIRRMKILQNTIICEETICTNRSLLALNMQLTSWQRFARTFLVGKRLVTYIFPFADFWASRVYHLDAYTVNLELDDNFKIFYDLIYLYIFTFYRSWPSCNWATYQVLFSILWFIFL